MTLILTIPAIDGKVMASDGQVTVWLVRSSAQKIEKLNPRCLWAASGELALIQRVQERMVTLSPDAPLPNLRDQIGQIVNQCVSELIGLDFRTRFLPQDPNLLLQLHPGDFVFAEASPEMPILHVLVNGTPEWIRDRMFASGSGDLFAYALLQKYQRKKLTLLQASLLAYKVIEEAIAVGAYGLGAPIDVWHIQQNGIKQLPKDEIAALEDACRSLREAEIELLCTPGAATDEIPKPGTSS
jgi:proteasome beta subunit